VLSFKASAFSASKIHIDKLIPTNPTAVVCPMSYNSADLLSVIANIIKAWNGANIGELCDHVLMISSMFKNDCWKSENEYRFFVQDNFWGKSRVLSTRCPQLYAARLKAPDFEIGVVASAFAWQ
jgi:hypothetical protein